MKKEQRGFLVGFIVAALMFSMVIPAVASTVQQINATYKNIKITLDGVELVPKDVNGNVVEPFVSGGTTYLPIRAVANALGLNVEWDGNTNTVKLTNPDVNVSASSGTVLMDQNGIKITFMGFEKADNYRKGYDIKLRIDNKSGKDYTVQVRDFSVNGIMADEIFSCDVTNGKTANDKIWVYNLEARGITPPITEAEFYFHIFNSHDWSDSFNSNTISIK